MRLTKPRIAPLSDAEMGPEHKEALKDFGPNIQCVVSRKLHRLDS